MAVLDGAGIIGGSIGTTDSPCTATIGIFPEATRFITGPIWDGVDSGMVDSITATAEETGSAATTADSRTAPAQPADLSTEADKRLEDTLNREVRAVFGRAHSAATTMAAKPAAFPHAEAPASAAGAAVADFMAADVANQGSLTEDHRIPERVK